METSTSPGAGAAADSAESMVRTVMHNLTGFINIDFAAAPELAQSETKQRKSLRMLANVSKELLQTQFEFAQLDLGILQRFLTLLPESNRSAELEPLIEVHSSLLNSLAAGAMDCISVESPSDTAETTLMNIISLFMKEVGDVMPLLKLHAPFCSAYEEALELVVVKRKMNKSFRASLEEMEEREENKRATLESALPKPVQRLMKYPGIIEVIASNLEKLEQTPAVVDVAAAVARARAQAKQVADAVNAMKKTNENQKLLMLASEQLGLPELVEPARQHVSTQDATFRASNSEGKDMYGRISIFNNLLIIAKPRGLSKMNSFKRSASFSFKKPKVPTRPTPTFEVVDSIPLAQVRGVNVGSEDADGIVSFTMTWMTTTQSECCQETDVWCANQKETDQMMQLVEELMEGERASTATLSSASTPTPTPTSTPTPTWMPTLTPTPALTLTPTLTLMPPTTSSTTKTTALGSTPTWTPMLTPTPALTLTPTLTSMPSTTSSTTKTAALGSTPTWTPMLTPTPTLTLTPTLKPTPTPTSPSAIDSPSAGPPDQTLRTGSIVDHALAFDLHFIDEEPVKKEDIDQAGPRKSPTAAEDAMAQPHEGAGKVPARDEQPTVKVQEQEAPVVFVDIELSFEMFYMKDRELSPDGAVAEVPSKAPPHVWCPDLAFYFFHIDDDAIAALSLACVHSDSSSHRMSASKKRPS